MQEIPTNIILLYTVSFFCFCISIIDIIVGFDTYNSGFTMENWLVVDGITNAVIIPAIGYNYYRENNLQQKYRFQLENDCIYGFIYMTIGLYELAWYVIGCYLVNSENHNLQFAISIITLIIYGLLLVPIVVVPILNILSLGIPRIWCCAKDEDGNQV